MVNNYSLDCILKTIPISKDKDHFGYDFHEYEHKKEYQRLEKVWEEKLNSVDFKFIENYVRKKRLEKINKINEI